MPWSPRSVVDHRLQFVADYLRGEVPVTELCERHAISRKTGYKWIARYREEGAEGLADRSRRPHCSPSATPTGVVDALLELRNRHPTWGAKKLLAVLQRRDPELVLPARSTVCALLDRHGMVQHRRRRSAVGHPGPPQLIMDRPNAVWCADFKGHFRMGDNRYCYPLTVTDGYSRYVLACEALTSTRHDEARPIFARLFKSYGIPDAILTDNGAPFASHGIGRLSKLSVWWIRLGITPTLIEPGKPQQNGRHERMHRTLKAETARPPAANRRSQQWRFDEFCHTFNHERPHEALRMTTPAEHYGPSSRWAPRPGRLRYPDCFETRQVSADGSFRWWGGPVGLSRPCAGLDIGMERLGDGLWALHLGDFPLGLFDEHKRQVSDCYGRIIRSV